jgi:hypothetical protein
MKIIYETDKYYITTIPLNYKIYIKKSMVLKDHNTGIERDWYSPLDWDKPFKTPLERAIWVAEEACNDHFRPITKEEQAFKTRLARSNGRFSKI